MKQPTNTQLILEMHEQIAQVHGAVFGEGNTKGLISTVQRIDTALAVHVDGGRAEARRTAAIVSTLVSVGTLMLAVVIFFTTGLPFFPGK